MPLPSLIANKRLLATAPIVFHVEDSNNSLLI